MRKQLLALAFLLAGAASAFAQSGPLSNLPAGNPVSGTDEFYAVQTPGVGGVRVIGSQLSAFIFGQVTGSCSATALGVFSCVPSGAAISTSNVLGNFTGVSQPAAPVSVPSCASDGVHSLTNPSGGGFGCAAIVFPSATITANVTPTAGFSAGQVTYSDGAKIQASAGFLTWPSPSTLQLGAVDAASPVAQTFQAQSVAAGTANTVGQPLTIVGSKSTGNVAGGSIVFQTTPAAGAGSTQNVPATAATINSAGVFSAILTTSSGYHLDLDATSGVPRLNGFAGGSLRGFVSIGDNSGQDIALNAGGGAGNVDLEGASVAFGTALDAYLTRVAAATMQQGAVDAASPVAQITQVQNVVAGTSNTAGPNWTINGSKGTGTGAGGNIIFQTAPAGGSGTSQNSQVQASVIDSLSHIRVGAGGAPAPSSCGTSPSLVGTDEAGEVTMGTTATGCTITFAKAYTSAPFCTVTWQANLASMQYTISNTAITLTQTSTSSNKVDYICRARNGG